jgi:hypothetical protein
MGNELPTFRRSLLPLPSWPFRLLGLRRRWRQQNSRKRQNLIVHRYSVMNPESFNLRGNEAWVPLRPENFLTSWVHYTLHGANGWDSVESSNRLPQTSANHAESLGPTLYKNAWRVGSHVHLALSIRTDDYTGTCFNNSVYKHCSALRDVSINKAVLLTGP